MCIKNIEASSAFNMKYLYIIIEKPYMRKCEYSLMLSPNVELSWQKRQYWKIRQWRKKLIESHIWKLVAAARRTRNLGSCREIEAFILALAFERPSARVHIASAFTMADTWANRLNCRAYLSGIWMHVPMYSNICEAALGPRLRRQYPANGICVRRGWAEAVHRKSISK